MASAEKIVEWLEKNDELHLGESPWGTVSEDEDVYLIDWKRVFPSRRPSGKGMFDWDVSGDDWDADDQRAVTLDEDQFPFAARVQAAIGGQRPSDEEGHEIAARLPWDGCAWYQPVYFSGHDWGIFIRRDGIHENALLIARFLPPGTPFTPELLKALIRAGFAALFLHEQFHHKVESLGIRLHVVERANRYIPYQKRVYQPTFGKDSNLEEALANADAFLRTNTSPYSTWMGKTVVMALREYLLWRFPFDPPGYRQAINYLTDSKLNRGIDLLHGQVQEARQKPKRAAQEWEIATRLHQSLYKVTDHLWEVVPRGSRGSMPVLAKPYPSISSRELVKLAENHGWAIKKKAGKGSHVRMECPGHPSLTIPPNRQDVSPGVLKTTLKAIGGYKLNDLSTLLAQR